MGKIDPKIMETVKRFKKAVAGKYGIVDIVLFGSAAVGELRDGSDIDLIVVVKDYDKRLEEKLLTEWHEALGIHYPVDFMQCSKSAFAERSKGINIISQALKEGVVF